MIDTRTMMTEAELATDRCRLLVGDCAERLGELPEASVQTCVTSPPYYGLRDYGVEGQLGLEETPEAFVESMVRVFRAVRRVLRGDGTLWLNIGDSYAGSWGAQSRGGGAGATSRLGDRDGVSLSGNQILAHPRGTRTGSLEKTPGCKPKDLIGIPWMLAFALRADGWFLRQKIIWHKPNPMPESVRDRCTKAHESLFLLAKSKRYFYDADAIAVPVRESTVGGSETRNRRSVWSVSPARSRGAHFAVMPIELARRCVLAGCPRHGAVLDPFTGSGTTGDAALRAGRRFVGVELNPKYASMARRRLTAAQEHEESRRTIFETTLAGYDDETGVFVRAGS